MNDAQTLCIFASGLFFFVGLLTGIWKYFGLRADPERGAHFYVDTAHRAALMYSFAALVVLKFVELSPFSETTTLLAAAAPLFFFAFAITLYLIHGLLQDTDNQFRPPHGLGGWRVPAWFFHGGMWALIVGEVGGFALLFWGFIQTQFS